MLFVILLEIINFLEISRNYGVLLEDQGITLRGLFIIDPQGVVRQITINDLPVGRDVDETLRLVQAFQVNQFFELYNSYERVKKLIIKESSVAL